MRSAWRAAALAGGIVGAAAAAESRVVPIEGYAALVNDRVILASDVRQLMSGEVSARAYRDALDTLIDRELILAEYAKKGVELPEQAINEQVDQIVAERYGGDRSRLLAQLRDLHLSYTEWRRQIKEQLVVAVMRREAVFDKVSLPPGAARQLYAERIDEYRTPAGVKLRMITVAGGTNEVDQAEKAARMAEARRRVQAGEDFAVVAREVSEGAKAADGGDWGWRPARGHFSNELDEAIARLGIGQLSDIVSVGGSLYLVRVEDRRPERVVAFDEVREDLETELRRAEMERIQNEWTARLREKHFVKIF